MLQCQARTDPTPAHLVDTTLFFKGHGLLQPGLLRLEVHRQLTMGLRVPATMALFMKGDLIGGSRLNGKRLCRVCCSQRRLVNVSVGISFDGLSEMY